ncbi:hypothetical protein COB52_05745, partial [Candidatus Kaiserbacteria bacterium]
IYKTRNFTIVQKWLLVGLLAAYSFQNLTVFDQVISYILFFSVVGWVVFVASDVWKKEREEESEDKPWYLVLLVIPIALVLIFTINVRPLQANILLLSGLQDALWADGIAQKGDVKKANIKAIESVSKIVEAAAMKTYGTQEIHEQLAHTSKQFIGREWVSQEVLQIWYGAAVAGMNSEKSRNPKDARFPVFLADVHSAFGQVDAEKEELELALTLSPDKQTILLNMANNSLRRKSPEEALEFSKKAYELERKNEFAQLFYAVTLMENGKMGEFIELYETHPRLGGDNRVLLALVKNKEFALADRVWEEYFIDDINAAFVLGIVYMESGYFEKAKKSVLRAMELEPSIKEEGERILESFR